MPKPSDHPVAEDARILLLRLSALGDIVFALPALRLLRLLRPTARIEWLCEDRHQQILAEHPDLDRVHVYPRRAGNVAIFNHLRRLRGEDPFDAVVDFQSNLKSALNLLAVRSSRTIGFSRPLSREFAHCFVKDKVGVDPRLPRAYRDIALVKRLVGSELTDELVEEVLHQPAPWPLHSPAPESSADILLHTSFTHYGRDKAWPRQSWIELASELVAIGRHPRFLWTKDEHQQVADLAASAECELAPATPDLPALMQLCDQANLLIGTDSGPLHLASWRGTPTIGLFGATDPAVYAPTGARSRIVTALEDGQSPPIRNRTNRSPLMDAITPAMVLAAVSRRY